MLTRENLEMRRNGVGGSEIGAVAGLDPWHTAVEIYERKVSPVAEEQPTNENLERGVMLEPALVRWVQKRTGLIVHPNDDLIVSPEFNWMVATPDALGFRTTDLSKRECTVEVKSPGRTQRDWTHPDEDPLGIPEYVMPQIQWTMRACGVDYAIVGALVYGRFLTYRIEAHPDLQQALVEAAHDFWTYVDRREPPPVEGAGDAKVLARLVRQTRKDLVTPENVDHAATLARTYHDLRAREKATAEQAEVIKGKLCEIIGTNRGIEVPGYRATWSQSKDGTKIDWEKVAREAGATDDLIAKYTKTVPGSRSFRVTEKKENPNGK